MYQHNDKAMWIVIRAKNNDIIIIYKAQTQILSSNNQVFNWYRIFSLQIDHRLYFLIR